MSKIKEIKVNIGIRRYCLWPAAILCALHLPLPEFMFYVRIAE